MPRPARPPDVRTLLRRDAFARASGVRLVEVGPGHALARLRLRPEHLNGVGVAQGGAIFTLADLAFAAAANSRGQVAVALDVSITFARPALAGTTLEAEAREESLGRRIAVVRVDVRDGDGKIVALFRGTAFRLEEPVAPPAARAAPARRGAARGPQRKQRGRPR